MSELRIRGKVIWMPGPWGLAAPAAGATVKIHQNSVLPPSRREIWSGTAAADGSFSGTTRRWRRTIRVRVGPIDEERPDPTDILAVTVEIAAEGRTMTFPFPYLADDLAVPPVVLPWIPSGLAMAWFDGTPCYTAAALAQRLEQLLAAPAPVVIEIPLPMPAPLGADLASALDRMLARVRETAGSAGTPRQEPPPMGHRVAGGAREGVAAGSQGVSRFGGNLVRHTTRGMTTWLTGADADVQLPAGHGAANPFAAAKSVARGTLHGMEDGVTAKVRVLYDILVVWNVPVPAWGSLPASPEQAFAQLKPLLTMKIRSVLNRLASSAALPGQALTEAAILVGSAADRLGCAAAAVAVRAAEALARAGAGITEVQGRLAFLLQTIMVYIYVAQNTVSGIFVRLSNLGDRVILAVA